MWLQRTNIENKLKQAASGSEPGEVLIASVYEILNGKDRSGVRNVLQQHPGTPTENRFYLDLLQTDRIFHISHIRNICIAYRLRFLDLKFFKAALPEEAFRAINQLEHRHGTTLNAFKILAPSRLFKLKDKDDPLLFVPLGNDYYYLVHKWGKDLHPFRRWLVWPFRNIGNLAVLVLGLSLCLTFMIPSGFFSNQSAPAEFWILFFFMFKSVTAVVIFYGFALGKNFNPEIWNSKYFNS